MTEFQHLRFTSEILRKNRNMEEKLQILAQCFTPSLYLDQGMHTIGYHPRRFFGYSIPSSATLDVLQQYIDQDTEVLEIGSCLGLYAFVFGSPLFCRRWIATDHPDTFKEWLPAGNPLPFAPIYITKTPLEMFSPCCPKEKRVLITVWPEPDSMYFWDEYVTKFDGQTVIIIGTPGVTGSEAMWDQLSEAFPLHYKATTVCKINLGLFFNYETVYVWSRSSGLDVHPCPAEGAITSPKA